MRWLSSILSRLHRPIAVRLVRRGDRWVWQFVLGGMLALAGGAIAALPVFSAEEIIITYGFIERSISVRELADFAAGQGLSNQLKQYAKTLNLSDQDLEDIRQVLVQPVDLPGEHPQVAIAQFLYTIQGETLLNILGEVIQTPSRKPAFAAMRAALILAASDPEAGLTPLNVIQKFPNPSIRIDVRRGFAIAQAVTDTVNRANRAIALVQNRANPEDIPSEAIYSARQLINDAPPYQFTTQEFTFSPRRIRATLYLPQSPSPQRLLPDRVPVIVISHGLGDDRNSYRYLSEYLVQRGFAVAALDHPGSNSQQIQSLLEGRSPTLIDAQEFLHRPQDVSALIDELQRFAVSDRIWRRRLDLQNVGVIGQSFGGYTALALAGAQPNPANLAAACSSSFLYLNPSLLLQCQARLTSGAMSRLRDDRVKAVFAVNPIGSAVFGPEGYGQIQIPTAVMAGVADTIAPALPEQIQPFSWLSAPERYLILVGDATHFSVIGLPSNGEQSIPVPSTAIGPDPAVAQDYLQVLSYAFFQRYLRDDLDYAAVLSNRYTTEILARSPFVPLDIIRSLSPAALDRALTGATP